MKAITIKQPWTSLIVYGIKDIENRTWKTKFRGRIYLHSSATFYAPQFTTEQIKEIESKIDVMDLNYERQRFVSAIIGEVDIIDCVINHPSIWAEKSPEYTTKRANQDGFKPIYNWVLANPVRYDKPIFNVKGKLSFWEYENK